MFFSKVLKEITALFAKDADIYHRFVIFGKKSMSSLFEESYVPTMISKKMLKLFKVSDPASIQ